MPDVNVQIVSVNVALPKVLGRVRGQEVRSGIAKLPVTADTLILSTSNLEGDRQADQSVHGGPDKAVYVYSADHFEEWTAAASQIFGPGGFGENLTVAGVTEADACIGARWSWGDALLEVVQPRLPCFKLAMHRGTARVGRIMMATARTGWYLRVLRPGTVPTTGTIAIEHHAQGISVADAYWGFRRPDSELAQSLLGLPELADGWRHAISSRSGK